MGLLLFGGNGFNPSKVTNLQLWYDATKITVADGASVSSWIDSSSNGYNATQVTALANPVFRLSSSSLNNKPCVEFTGSTHLGLPSGALALTNNLAACTIFIVCNHSTSAAITNLFHFSLGVSSSTNPRIAIRKSAADKLQVATRRLDADTGTITHTITGTSLNKVVLHSSIVNPSGNEIISYLNGTQDPSTTTTFTATGNFDTNNSTSARIGSANGVNFFSGFIGEILFYTRKLNSSELNSVNKYLKSKWGIV